MVIDPCHSISWVAFLTENRCQIKLKEGAYDFNKRIARTKTKKSKKV